ncbi:MAG: DUF4252 domain-containing protein [Acidobacteria bacterium]|nr:DUF4252 domain-containing protein [Acidobacteriota bacterium]
MIEIHVKRWHALFALAFLAMAVQPRALAQTDAEVRAHPGFVDGAVFATAVNDGAACTEIAIKGPVLRGISRKLLETAPDAAKALNEIVAIHAVIIEDLAPTQSSTLRAKAEQVLAKLAGAGWERVARVREKQELVEILLRYEGDDRVVGLTIVSTAQSEFSFVNIAGRIDVAKLAAIGEAVHLPGLDVVDQQKEGRED